MSKDKQELKHSTTMKRQDVIAFLDTLCDGFGNGSLNIEHDGESISLSPGGLIDLKVKAKVKQQSGRITLTFDWTEPDDTE